MLLQESYHEGNQGAAKQNGDGKERLHRPRYRPGAQDSVVDTGLEQELVKLMYLPRLTDLSSARARNAFASEQAVADADKGTMINELLDLLLPKRTRERDVETFRRGLVRLLANRASDNDPINRRAASKSVFDRTTSTS